MKKYIFPVLFATTLSACSLTPILKRPDIPIPMQYPFANETDTHQNITNIDWQIIFPDPRLQNLIELALINNRDIRLAAINVESVKLQYGIQNKSRIPTIDATASMTRQRDDTEGGMATSTKHNFGFGVSVFELDLFGRARSLTDAAFSRYLASEQGHRAAKISLVGAIADTYYLQLQAHEQLQLAQQILTGWRQSLELVRHLKKAQQNSALDVYQVEGQVAMAEVDLETRTRAVDQAHNAMQFLVGTDIPNNLPSALLLEELPRHELPAGLPSDLLIRRPDILQAENNLRAANADIGAARAAFFPRLSLTTSFGYNSPEIQNLFESGNKVWSFVPQLTLPIFNAGRLKSELRLAELRKSSAIVEYERSIQTAFREVADGLVNRETYGRQIEAQQRMIVSAAKRLELSTLRYRAGLDGRLEFLEAQRQLYLARQNLIDLRTLEMRNAVALYKALGGDLSVSRF